MLRCILCQLLTLCATLRQKPSTMFNESYIKDGHRVVVKVKDSNNSRILYTMVITTQVDSILISSKEESLVPSQTLG